MVQGQESGIPGVLIDTFTTSPTISINAQGKVYFFANLSGSNVTPVTTGGYGDSQAGFVANGSSLTLAIRRDDIAAGFPAVPAVFYGDTGTAFSQFLGTASTMIDDSGAVTFRPFLNGLSITPGVDDQGFYIGQPGSEVLVAQRGTVLPASAIDGGLTAGYKYGDLNFNAVAQNGNLVFYANVLTSTDLPAGAALFAGSGPNTSVIAYGNALSGTMIGGERLGSISTGRWTADASGQVLFSGTLTTGANGSNTAALVRGSSAASLTILARQGDVSPIGAGVTYNAFDFSERAATGSHVAFLSTLTGPGINASGSNKNNTAFFMTDPTSGVLKTLVRENAPAVNGPLPPDFSSPTATEMRFATLDNLKLSSSGWALFSAQLRADNATSASTTHDGLYVGRIDAGGNPEVKEVALERDRASFSQAALHYERGDFDWHLERWNGISGEATGINSNGQVVFYAGASAPGSSLTEVDGYFFYDPTHARAFRLIAPGDQIMVDPDGPGPLPASPRTVSTLSTLTGANGGAGDGRPSIFNDNKELVFKATYDGGEGIFTLDADDYVPISFHVWDETAGGAWGDDANWLTTSPDGARTYAEFSDAITAPAPITITGGKTVGEIYFKNANRVTLSGDAITMQGVADLGHVGVAAGDHEIASNMILADTTSFVIDKQFVPAGTSAVFVDASLLVSGAVSGPGGLRKGGPGVLRLTGANSYAGDTFLRAGYLEVQNSANLGSASNRISLDGGVLRFLQGFNEPRPIEVTSVTRDTSDIHGGVDTGTNTVTLSGAMSYTTSSSGSDGYIYKGGTGTLNLAGTGGVGGVEVTEGTVQVTTPQTWGNATSRAMVGATFVVTATGSITSTSGAAFVARGGGTMTFDGPVNTDGSLQASWDATNGPGTVTINAPSSFGSMSTSSRSGTNFAGQFATINVNANTVVSGAVTINGSASSTNVSVLNMGPGATLTANTYSISGTVVSGTSNVILQTGTSTSGSAFGLIVGGNGFNPSGTVTTAADISLSSTAASDLSGPVSVGRDVRTTGSANNLTFSGPSLVVGRNVLIEGGSTNVTTVNFNSPVTTIAGQVNLDADSNNEIKVVNFNGASGTSAGMLINIETVSTNMTATSRVNINPGATHTTGDVILSSLRASTSTSTNQLNGLAKLTVGGTLNAGSFVIRADEFLANRNFVTGALEVSGNATFDNLRHISRRGTNAAALTPLPAPTIGGEDIRVTTGGTLTIRPNGGPGGTSVLAKAPTIQGGKLDLNDNALIVNYTIDALNPNSPIGTIRAYLQSGYAAGAWNGTGIASTAASGNGSRALGFAEASQVLGLAGTNTATFQGQSADSTSVLVRYTVAGDATLDGAVDFNDLVRLAQNYNLNVALTTESWWYSGDFTYDGFVDFNDLVKLAQNYNTALPSDPIPGAPDGFAADFASAMAAVPEPSLGIAALFAAAAATTRVRRRRQN